MKSDPTNENPCRGVSLWRRLASMLYDSIVVVCVIFVAWLPVPLITDDHWPQAISQGWRLAYLFMVIYIFFGWFWRHGGQTLGMKAWKIRLEDADSEPGTFRPISWTQAFVRLSVALLSWAALGAGYLWSFIDENRRTWHDQASRSRLTRVDRFR